MQYTFQRLDGGHPVVLSVFITNRGFGGLVVSMLVSDNEAVERKNPQHAFLRRGSKAVCPMSQICGM
jgi:hypothetical protein